MMRATLAWLLLGGIAQAQTAAAPAGTQINPNRVIIGTAPGTVAGGDALAGVSATASAAAQSAAAAVAASIASVQVDATTAHLIVTLLDGTTIDAGPLPTSFSFTPSLNMSVARNSGYLGVF
jgi:hypothetical protein